MRDMMAFQAISAICMTAAFVASLRFLRGWLELRHDKSKSLPPANETSDRLDRIESIVEATAVEVESISEANSFMSKLLAERTGALPPPANRPERVITPH